MKKFIHCVAIAGLLAAGCGKASDTVADKATELAIEKAAGAEGKDVDVKVNSSSGSFEMTQTTDGGKTTSSIGDGTKMPTDWPKDVPVPDGLTLLMAQSTPEQGQFMISGTTTQTLEQVAAFFKDKIPAQGWKMETAMSFPGNSETTLYKKDDRSLTATANVEDGKVALVLAVSK